MHIVGSEQAGNRPFIVMSRNYVNRRLKTVLVVPMTTFQNQVSMANQPPYRIVIPAAEITTDPSYTGTLAPVSVAKTDQTRVVDNSRLGQKIGRLSQTAVISVGAGIAFVIDHR